MSAPYYQDDLVTLYLGDCLESQQWLGADVLVTDPPYGMGYLSNFNKTPGVGRKVAGDHDTKARDTVLAQWGERPAVVFGTWRVERPAKVRQLVIWDKGDSPGLGDLALPWGPSHEDIYILGTGFTGKRGASVIRANTLAPGSHQRPDHPTPKPIGLMERLVGHTLGVVADPFAGSGATLIAARNLGRTAIGVELEERYCEIIATRLSQQAFDLEGL